MSPEKKTSWQIRDELAETLRLDLVGPGRKDTDLADEQLPNFPSPSSHYLTGFLIPDGTPADRAGDADAEDEIEVVGEEGLAEESSEDRRAARRSFFPSSMGLSFLLAPECQQIEVEVHWGDYLPEEIPIESEGKDADAASSDAEATEEEQDAESPAEQPPDEQQAADGESEPEKTRPIWKRQPRMETLAVSLSSADGEVTTQDVPQSGGLQLVAHIRTVEAQGLSDQLPKGTRSVSVFLVNRRPMVDGDDVDITYAFQPELVIHSEVPFLARPDLRSLADEDWDDDVADLHYADTPEYATGHGISVEWRVVEKECREVRTAWLPTAQVERTETVPMDGVELSLDVLGQLSDAAAVHGALDPLVAEYRNWIHQRGNDTGTLSQEHGETAEALLHHAGLAADRIEQGIEILASDPDAIDAFRLANRAVSQALKKRLHIDEPLWRPFQLAFILLNLPGIVHPTDADRKTVDLLFFPTGGGKTEAYLGLAAFTMVLRRLNNPGLTGAGVSVMMRYTLRLLTLDQLGRAAGLVCALELEREKEPERYGQWPFEIGLWVGKAATPNRMGFRGDKRRDSARDNTRRYKNTGGPAPIPLESCPWCGEAFTADSFQLLPNDDRPTDLRVSCSDFECDFSGDRPLPIVAVDEPIYRRLPAFLVATIDKFASLPWTGESGLLLGGAQRFDADGFYGPATAGKGTALDAPLPPIDLIIQDELHLIAGPLGTMAGLYETVIDALCARDVDGQQVRPKVVASTATARRAMDQVQSLFGRSSTQIFPPQGVDRRDSFFARTVPADESAPRLYLGIVAFGRNPKVALRRTWISLMSAAQHLYMEAGGYEQDNPADPYMTVLGYFSSLRELGGSRRILEEEVQNSIKSYWKRNADGKPPRFRDRKSWNEVVELTSRVSTTDVSKAKQRLGTSFSDKKQRVDAAIATNMISVGLDITRLGLMVVFGQPKNHSEYIQATSRVGRDEKRPGLVVTLLNIYRPRDRSHYERFRHYHETFYRSVEVASVTPFSPRALDRGLAGALVALARHRFPQLTPAAGAMEIEAIRPEVEKILQQLFAERLEEQGYDKEEINKRKRSLHHRIADLLDSWAYVIQHHAKDGEQVHYQRYETRNRTGVRPLLQEILDTGLEDKPHHWKFRANRSLRDVEPEIKLWLRDMTQGQSGGAQ